jgi:predicted metal-dependent HD superfamily phosphohydrolase
MESSNGTAQRDRVHQQFLGLDIQTPPHALEKWSNEVLVRYSESQRHYHTLSHIDSMLSLLSQHGARIQDKTVIMLAIFFHDIIYDPKAKDNEVQSIECFKIFAKETELPEETTTLVTAFINATITHSLDDTLTARDAGKDLKIFLDFDLEVLSRKRSQYGPYSEQIRMEYNHLSDRDYFTGRTKVLSSFLDRERIYFSDVFYDTCEANARRNITDELEYLQALISNLKV